MKKRILVLLFILSGFISFSQDELYNQFPNDNRLLLHPRASFSKHLPLASYLDSLKRYIDSVDYVVFVMDSIALAERYLDSLELVNLYNSTNGNNWTIKTNWLSANPIETWYGITTSSEVSNTAITVTLPGSVSQIKLSNNNINGSITLNGSRFKNLDTIDLSLNTIPNHYCPSKK